MSESEVLSAGPDLGRPIPLHPLVYLPDGEDVTVGRRDIDSYAVLPPDGAALVRKMEEGLSPVDAAAWYESEYGEPVDVADVVEALYELEFVRSADDVPAGARRLRWQRTGRVLFSTPAWLLYGGLAVWALALMVAHQDLRPTYRNIFYVDYYSVIQATLFVAALPLLLLHEAFHALAGRRLGLPSTMSVGRRLYFIVLETSMDGLVSVPRRQRYLPIIAGIMVDLVVVAGLTVAADLTRQADGALSLGGRFCLAVAFATLLRVAWQFSFFLRTDLYVLVSTALGCVDLHTTAKQAVANKFHRLLGRTHKLHDESAWHPVDRRVARWYSWFVLVGYAFSLTTFVLALAPVTYFMFRGVFTRLLDGSGATALQLLDSSVFLTFSLVPIAVYGLLALRDRRRKRA
ncbi:MAG: hypothetical protein ABIQ18_39410 [Umezawaea sp.]